MKIKSILLIVGLIISQGLFAEDLNMVRVGYSVFEVAGNGEALNFPVFSKTISVDDIIYSVDKSNYYYQKLSKLYNLDKFNLIKTGSWDGVVDEEVVINEGKPLFTHSIKVEESVPIFSKSDNELIKSTINIYKELEVAFIEFADDKAKFTMRVKNEIENRKHSDVQIAKLVIQSGKSGSVGSMYSKEENKAVLIVLWVESLKVNKKTSQKDLDKYFTKIKGTPNFTVTDQIRLDKYFHKGKLVIPKEYIQRVVFVEYDKPPRALSPITPEYPKDAQEAGTEGTVIIQCFINDVGVVELIKILKGADAALDKSAIEAVKKVKFKPAKKDGEAVGVWISIPINFSLSEK